MGHPTTVLKERESGHVKVRGEEEVFVATHNPCGHWGIGSSVVLQWEKEQAFSFSDEYSDEYSSVQRK